MGWVGKKSEGSQRHHEAGMAGVEVCSTACACLVPSSFTRRTKIASAYSVALPPQPTHMPPQPSSSHLRSILQLQLDLAEPWRPSAVIDSEALVVRRPNALDHQSTRLCSGGWGRRHGQGWDQQGWPGMAACVPLDSSSLLSACTAHSGQHGVWPARCRQPSTFSPCQSAAAALGLNPAPTTSAGPGSAAQ